VRKKRRSSSDRKSHKKKKPAISAHGTTEGMKRGHITILGTSHDIQVKGRKFSIDDRAYPKVIDLLLFDKDFVFEEATGFGPTIAETKMTEKMGPGHYLDIDPALRDRAKHGIGDTSGPSAVIDHMVPSDGWLYGENVSEQAKREEVWLQRIRERQFHRAVLVCGYLHLLSMAFRLHLAGFRVEAYYYMPYDKLCRKAHMPENLGEANV
jgi:hypothetical protein